MVLTRPELELKRRAPLVGGQPGTREFARGPRFIVGTEDTDDFQVVGNANDEIQAALDALTVGRTWKEIVKVRGDLTIGDLNTPILQPDYSVLDLTEVRLTLVAGAGADQRGVIENDDPTNGNQYLDILGGFFDLTRAEQTQYCFGILYDNVSNFILDKQVVQDSYGGSIETRGASHDGLISPILLTNPRDDGLSIRDESYDITVLGGEYSYANGLAAPNGIEIEDGAHDITVIAPHCHHNDDGILIAASADLDPATDIEIISPHCHHNDASGIHLYNGAAANAPVRRVNIRGPRTNDNGYSGIYVQGVAENIIEDVKIHDIISIDETTYNLVTGYCKNVQMKATHLEGAGTRPYQRGAGSINTMVGNRELWLYNVFMETVGATQRTLGNAGRCYLVPVQVKEGCVMSYYNLLVGAVTAGSIRCGIYADAGFVPDTGALLDEQWFDATTFTVDQVNRVNMTDLWLPSGIYWLVMQSSATTLNVFGHDGPATMALGGLLQTRYFDQAWGVFPAECPATTLEEEIPDYIWIEKA